MWEVADISADEGGGISLGIEGELEVPEVEGVAELEGIPKEPKSPLLGSLRAGN